MTNVDIMTLCTSDIEGTEFGVQLVDLPGPEEGGQLVHPREGGVEKAADLHPVNV